MKIYTKTGDQGETSLIGGSRVTKDCVTLRVVGELDELNAALGLALTQGGEKGWGKLAAALRVIQRDLFKLGAELASGQTDQALAGGLVGEKEIMALEKMIDQWWSVLPTLNNFILPGGQPAAAVLHLARAICRRAERELVAYSKEASVRPLVQAYMNRLSDWLFTAARWVNHLGGSEEEKVV